MLILESDWKDTFSVDISPACFRRVVSQCSFIVSPQGGGKRLSLSESLTVHSTARSKALIHSKRDVMKHAVEIIFTLRTTFKGLADQQSVDDKTEMLLSLDMTTYFHKYTWLSLRDRRRKSHVLSRSLSLSFAVCLGLCKSVVHMSSLLAYLIFRTPAWRVKREGHNLMKKEGYAGQ